MLPRRNLDGCAKERCCDGAQPQNKSVAGEECLANRVRVLCQVRGGRTSHIVCELAPSEVQPFQDGIFTADSTADGREDDSQPAGFIRTQGM